MLILFCVRVIIMTQRISGTIQQRTNEDDDDQFPKRTVVRGSNIKGSYSVLFQISIMRY